MPATFRFSTVVVSVAVLPWPAMTGCPWVAAAPDGTRSAPATRPPAAKATTARLHLLRVMVFPSSRPVSTHRIIEMEDTPRAGGPSRRRFALTVDAGGSDVDQMPQSASCLA